MTRTKKDVLGVSTTSEDVPTVTTRPVPPGTAALSIVVTHYKTPEILSACLESLHAAGVRAPIIVADSEASPGFSLPTYPDLDLRYLPFSANVGFAALVNAGIAQTRTPFILVINADVTVDRSALDQLVDQLETNPDIGILCPLLRNVDGTRQESLFEFHKPSTLVFRRTPLGGTEVGRRELARFSGPSRQAVATADILDVDWALGAAMLIRREAAEQVGQMDERYFLYFEDVDWCLRMWRHGWRVAALPSAEFTHQHARASRRDGVLGVFTNPLLRTHITSAARFFALYGPRPRRAQP